MTSHPSAIELIEAVTGFIEERATRQPDQRDAFLARVAVNALAIVKRELEQGRQAQAAAVERLTALLGHPGDFASLNAALCEKLAAGEFDLTSPGVMEHLRASVADQVAIDQPGYSGLRTLREKDA